MRVSYNFKTSIFQFRILMNLNFEECLNLKKLGYYESNKAFRTTYLTLKKHPRHHKYGFKNSLKTKSQQTKDPNNKLIIQN